MSAICPVSGNCIRASICEGFDDGERIVDLLSKAPEVQVMAEVLAEDELIGLMRPVIEAWNSAPCYQARVQALRDLQLQKGISHVSMTMGYGVVAELEKTQLEF